MIRYEAELRLSATAAWRLNSAPGEGCKTCRGLILKRPIWHLFYGRFTHAPSDACRGFFSAKERITRGRIWWWKFVSDSKCAARHSDARWAWQTPKFVSGKKRTEKEENWCGGLTLNFLMFHEVTKPHEQEKNAGVEVVFQHPKHDGEAKWSTYLTQAALK